jgi:molybdenum-dependent DNA-binding transcriptional regulator ModE
VAENGSVTNTAKQMDLPYGKLLYMQRIVL